jgi:hypothetical protein
MKVIARFTWAMLLMVLVFAGSAPAYAQGGGAETTLSGVVSDTSGGVLPRLARDHRRYAPRRDAGWRL